MLDHIILGVPELDAGIDAFRAATGVTPVRGGRHPGRGTENALVALGDGTYLELIAPVPGEAPDSEFLTFLRQLARPTPVGWALRVKDAAAARERLSRDGYAVTAVNAGSRLTPSGEKLEWDTFELTQFQTPAAPFFIAWRDMSKHPSRSAPSGCTIARFDLADPAAATLSAALRHAGFDPTIAVAEKTAMALSLRCGDHAVTFE